MLNAHLAVHDAKYLPPVPGVNASGSGLVPGFQDPILAIIR
jgi:hypothetical protein